MTIWEDRDDTFSVRGLDANRAWVFRLEFMGSGPKCKENLWTVSSDQQFLL